MKKKWLIGVLLLIVLVIIIIVVVINFKKEKLITESTPLFEMKEYQNITADKIEQINIIRYTEGGSDSTLEEDKKEIERTYHYLSQLRVGKETDMACEDNTTIYILQLQEEETVSIEIECDWIVMNNKRYTIIK